MSKRYAEMIGCLVVALLLVAVNAMGGSPAAGPRKQPVELVVFTPTLQGEIMQDTVGKRMLEQFNTKVIWQDVQGAESYAKILAQKDKPEVSVASTDIVHYLLGQKAGLWAKLDTSIITNLAQVQAPAKAFGEYSVGFNANTFVIQYRTDIFKEKGFTVPKGYADLARPEFKGRVGLTSTTSGIGIRQLVMFARTRGGDERNIAPGFAFTKELVSKGQINSFPTKSSTFNQAMQQGEIWIGTQLSEAALQFMAQGAPVGFAYPQEGLSLSMMTLQVVKGAPHQEEAQQFVNLMLGEEFQKAITERRWAIPVRMNLPLAPEYAKMLPLSADEWKRMYQHDWGLITESRAAWHDRWIKEIERKQ